jgi:hypothetical protein
MIIERERAEPRTKKILLLTPFMAFLLTFSVLLLPHTRLRPACLTNAPHFFLILSQKGEPRRKRNGKIAPKRDFATTPHRISLCFLIAFLVVCERENIRTDCEASIKKPCINALFIINSQLIPLS